METKKPNVIIKGNGVIRNGGRFYMNGASGESIEDSVHIINSGEMVTNDLSISGNSKLENSGSFFSNKMSVGKDIEKWATRHPWYFAFLFMVLGVIFGRLSSIFSLSPSN